MTYTHIEEVIFYRLKEIKEKVTYTHMEEVIFYCQILTHAQTREGEKERKRETWETVRQTHRKREMFE